MYTIRSVGAVSPYAAAAGGMAVLRAGQIPASALAPKAIARWKEGNPKGYDAAQDCYRWGHKPKPPELYIHGVRLQAATEAFWVCPTGTCAKPKACPPPITCPVHEACPAPEVCPVCATLPPPGMAQMPPPGMAQMPPPGMAQMPPSTTEDTGKFGVNIGLLIAGVMTAGVGYYGYKKGWFKGLKRRR